MFYRQQQHLRSFLEERGILADNLDIERESEAFLANLKEGLAVQKLDMDMLPSFISIDRNIPAGECALVIDAGGSHLRIAAICFDEAGQGIVESFATYRMPGTQGAVSRQEFFDFLVEKLKPLFPLSHKLGFCFSFSCEIESNRDGRCLGVGKEVVLTDMEGELLGENLRAAMRRAGLDDRLDVCVLNDTTAALLGGYSRSGRRVYDSYMGFILGTGTNIAYIEENARIGRLKGKLDLPGEGHMIINMESGKYPMENRSELDRRLDASTQMPGDHRLEKMLSGRYKGSLLKLIMEEAAREGLFTETFAQRLNAELAGEHLGTKEIDIFLRYPTGAGRLAALCAAPSDQEMLYGLIENLEERSARLICMSFYAVLKWIGKGRDPLKPVAVTIDGSTLLKSDLLMRRLNYYVEDFLKMQKGFYIDLIPSDNSNLLGAAAAILLNS